MDDETKFSDREWFMRQWKEANVPLSAAVLWIATNGAIETEHVIATREAISRAQHILITSLSDGDITASGHPEGKVSETTDVPPRSFDCEFLPIGEPLPLSDVFDDDSDPTLRWGALGEIDWRRGGRRGDTIENCHFVIWTRLSVKKSEIIRHWPRPDTPASVAPLVTFDDDNTRKFRGFENELVPLSDAVAFVARAIAKSGSGSERSGRRAGKELYDAIHAGTLTAFGTKRRGGEPEQISVSDFPTYAEPFGGSLYSNAPVQPPRFRWRENRERHVRTGEGDVIEDESGVRWRNICARRDDLIAAWPEDRLQKSSDIERYRVKGSFDAKLWTLDQVKAWAMSRSRDLVELAGEHPEHGSITTLDTLIAYHQSQEKQKGRDIEAELWSAIGLARAHYRFDIHSYLTSLLEQGRLHAFGREPRETAARELSPFDWAGLKIGCSGDTDRLGVWRREQPTRGKGDVLHVRISRDDVLREFPQSSDGGDAEPRSKRPRTVTKPAKLVSTTEFLKTHFPGGNPSLTDYELLRFVGDKATDIGEIGLRTLQEARKKAFRSAD